jgi:diguanylate cyclase (GGDEF)-like protein
VIATALVLYAAWAIAARGPRDARSAGQFLGAMLVFAVATWLARMVAMLVVLAGDSDPERIDLVVSLFAIAQMVNGVAATLSLIWIDVRLMQAELSRVAHTDALTGLPNRREVRRRFQEEASRAARHGHSFAVVLFDVDHFKQVNDQHGHAVGDTVLQGIGNVLAAAKRNEDVLGRIGGEEFLVVLMQQTREGAAEAANRLREALRAAELAAGSEPLHMTLSGGVALYPDDGAHWDALFATADRRLYAAKRAGRDRVEANG